MMRIDWQSSDNVLIENPHLAMEEREALAQAFLALPQRQGYVGIFSSGSYGDPRLVIHRKENFLSSAKAVQSHLELSSDDVCLAPLPLFHVGGLSILARSQVSGFKVHQLDSWDVQAFHDSLVRARVTVTSLVPTQLYDLVQSKLPCPSDLRSIVIGGAKLEKDLYFRAREIGWPVLPSYGSTETCSQIATASLQSLTLNEYPSLELLEHASVRIDEAGRICIRCESLFCGYLRKGEIFAPRDESSEFCSSDLGELTEDGSLKVYGRSDDLIKINGELISLNRVESLVGECLPFSGLCRAVALEDQRAGQSICIVYEGSSLTAQQCEEFQGKIRTRLQSIEIPSYLLALNELPRLANQKIDLAKLRQVALESPLVPFGA